MHVTLPYPPRVSTPRTIASSGSPHLWPWLPAYLGAVRDLPAAALAPWAELILQTLTQEHAPCELLPAALREATPPVQADRGLDELIGGRRSALRVMFSQQPERTASWLAGEAARWSRRHLAVAFGDQVQQWWAERAATTARALAGGRPVSDAD